MTKTLRGKEKRVFCFGGWMIFKLKAVVSDQAIISSIFTLLMFFMVEPLRCGFTLSSLFFQTCGRRASICWMTVCFLLPTVLICQYVTTAQQYHMCAQATNYLYLCLHFTAAACFGDLPTCVIQCSILVRKKEKNLSVPQWVHQ